MRALRIAILLLLTTITLSCGSGIHIAAPKRPGQTAAALPYQSKTAFVNGVHINYLDWHGSGPALIMIHGLGNTPHVFDDLAVQLKDRFHIIAYARRGHGHSDEPAGPYDLNTLVEDLKQLLYTLHIEKASLLGWSMGGNEITQFAGLYPGRGSKLVYLEAGYDWSDPTFSRNFARILSVNTPNANDMSSLDSFKRWYHTAWIGDEYPWTPALDAYILDASRLDSDGRVTTVPHPAAAALLIQSLTTAPRNYKAVQAPALAIYSSRFFPTNVGPAEATRQVNDWDEQVALPFRQRSMRRIRSELPNVTVLQIPNTTHMSIGIYKTKALADTIANWLLATH